MFVEQHREVSPDTNDHEYNLQANEHHVDAGVKVIDGLEFLSL